MKNSISLSVIFIGVVIALASCGGSGNDASVNPQDTVLSDKGRIDSLDAQKKKIIEFKFSVAEANLPSPFEIVNDIYSYKVNFNPEILNPYSSIDKYQSAYKKAVNYGVYGIDLAYTNFYGQNQELLNYYIATKKLAEGLNIEETFNEFANSFNKNSNNKDSIVEIVDRAYNETDTYLKKNERYLAASHVLAGALIEVNYISLNLLKDMKQDTSNAKLFEKVYNEKLYIYYLVKLYEEYTDKDSKALLTQMQSFKKTYDDLVKSPDDLTPENISKVVTELAKIRSKIVS